jgi:DNA-binding transcriptional MerR regulator
MQPQKMNMSKKQFRIGDLAEELKVKKFVIRFWEKEFGIQSDRSQGGQRFYTVEDLKTFMCIKDLLYKQGFTIAGAKKQLPEMLKARVDEDSSAMQSLQDIVSVVSEIPVEVIPQPVLVNNVQSCAATEEESLEENPMSEVVEEPQVQAAPDVFSHDEDTDEMVTPATKVPTVPDPIMQQLRQVKEQLLDLKSRLANSDNT